MNQPLTARSPMNLFTQLLRFGVIGASAALCNFILVVALVELTSLHPLQANIFAYACAFWISYLGHKYWTFNNKNSHKQTLHRFFLIAFLGFLLNESLFAALLPHLYYPVALLIVLSVVPVITFVLSKFWAFKQ